MAQSTVYSSIVKGYKGYKGIKGIKGYKGTCMLIKTSVTANS